MEIMNDKLYVKRELNSIFGIIDECFAWSLRRICKGFICGRKNKYKMDT